MSAPLGPHGEPTTGDLGDVTYVASFPNSFFVHTIEEAREAAVKFQAQATTVVYRIEVVEVLPHTPVLPEEDPCSPAR